MVNGGSDGVVGLWGCLAVVRGCCGRAVACQLWGGGCCGMVIKLV